MPGVLATNLEAIASGQLFGASNPNLLPVETSYGALNKIPRTPHQSRPAESVLGLACRGALEQSEQCPVAQLQVAALADWPRETLHHVSLQCRSATVPSCASPRASYRYHVPLNCRTRAAATGATIARLAPCPCTGTACPSEPAAASCAEYRLRNFI